MTKPIVGEKFEILLFGKLQMVTVLAVYKFGAIDIETETGTCFRMSGLSFI